MAYGTEGSAWHGERYGCLVAIFTLHSVDLVYTLLGMAMNSFIVTYYGAAALDLIVASGYSIALSTVLSIVILLQALAGPAFLTLTR